MVVVSIGVGVAALAGGFAIDFAGFAGNVLAEAAGIVFSVLLAVFVVERLLDADRRQRWALVANGTTHTLEEALTRAGLNLYLRLEAPRPPMADPFTMSMAGFSHLVEAMRRLASEIEALTYGDLGDVEEWLPPVKEQVQLIQVSVMPRLLTLGDPSLIAAVAEVESAFQNVEYEVWLVSRFGYNGEASAVSGFVKAMGSALVASRRGEPDEGPEPRRHS